MIRQNILIKLAVDKAIEILKNNPQAGEMYEGDVLNTLSVLTKNNGLSQEQLIKLKSSMDVFECKIESFEWLDVDNKNHFINTIHSIKAI